MQTTIQRTDSASGRCQPASRRRPVPPPPLRPSMPLGAEVSALVVLSLSAAGVSAVSAGALQVVAGLAALASVGLGRAVVPRHQGGQSSPWPPATRPCSSVAGVPASRPRAGTPPSRRSASEW